MGTASNEEKKQFLWGYRDSLRRIERIKAEMEELRAMRANISAGGGGARRKGYKNDLSGRRARVDALEKDRQKELDVLMQVHERIETAINSLEDTREQDVLFYHYIKGLTWWEIAERMGCTDRWARKLHGRALAHLKFSEEFLAVPP